MSGDEGLPVSPAEEASPVPPAQEARREAIAFVVAAASWLVPGLGHALLKMWGRAVICFLTVGVLVRSEEHTSELQSRLHLVCRLLLEKKKKKSKYSIKGVNVLMIVDCMLLDQCLSIVVYRCWYD